MSEREPQPQPEIPAQLQKEPKIGDVIAPLTFSQAEWVTNLGAVADTSVPTLTKKCTIDFNGVAKKGAYVTLLREGVEEPTFGEEMPHFRNIERSYDHNGFMISSTVLRSEGVLPSTERVFHYGRKTADGKRKVIQIDDYFLSQDGKREFLAATQSLKDGQKATEFFPKDPGLQVILAKVFAFPAASQISQIHPDAIQKLEAISVTYPNSPIRMI